ncbi:MAG: cytochrome c biogenesis protein CcdA [Endomicrobiales bacterium]|nr:cytochrome c biogenesis protein CcdA [Endomicrobiales bacterium]
MSNFSEFPIIASFLAGIATFISPCVLPLIPAYITFITGASLDDLKTGKNSAIKTFLYALSFVLGFSIIFILLGVSASALGNALSQKKDIIRWAGGIIIIVFGIHITGIIKIKFLYQEKRFQMQKSSLGYLGAFFIGIVFAIGWTPCVGPILSSILILASTQDTVRKGTLLLIIYSTGLAIPFLLTALFINKALQIFTRIKKYFGIIETASGVILVLIGILIITDSFKVITIFFNKILG